MAMFTNLDGGFQKEINYADLLKVLWPENQLGFLSITHLLCLCGPCPLRRGTPSPSSLFEHPVPPCPRRPS